MGHYERFSKHLKRRRHEVQLWLDSMDKAGPDLMSKLKLPGQYELCHSVIAFLEAARSGVIPRPKDQSDMSDWIHALWFELHGRAQRLRGEQPISLVKATFDPQVAKAANALIMDTPSKNAGNELAGLLSRSAVHTLAFEQEGQRVYEVSDGLSDRLANTELKGLLTDDIRLPFPALYIGAPRVPQFRLWNTTTGWHQFEGVYLLEDRWAVDMLKFLKQGQFATVSELAKSDWVLEHRSLHLLLTGLSKNPKDDMDDATFKLSIDLEDGKKLDQQVEAAATRFEAEDAKTDWRNILNWVVNVMIYATWPDAERDHVFVDPEVKKLWARAQRTKGQKARKLHERLKQMDNRKIMLLGKSIRIDRTAPQTNGEGTGREIEVRFRVSGHWKNQPHGAQNLLRKLIWVEPYWKGSEDSPLKLSTYKLDARETLHEIQDPVST